MYKGVLDGMPKFNLVRFCWFSPFPKVRVVLCLFVIWTFGVNGNGVCSVPVGESNSGIRERGIKVTDEKSSLLLVGGLIFAICSSRKDGESTWEQRLLRGVFGVESVDRDVVG